MKGSQLFVLGLALARLASPPSPAEADVVDPARLLVEEVLANGADYAKWLSRVTLPQSKLVDTSAGFEDQILVDEAAVTHSHGPEGEHSHGETVSATWLDLSLAARQARAVLDAFVEARPASEAYFRERFEALRADLAELDAAFENLPNEDRALLSASSDFRYLARRYGLDLRSFRYDPADMLGGDFWHDVEHAVEERPARFMLWERPPSEAARERLREMGTEPIVFDPAGAESAEGDFLSTMRLNLERLERALSAG